MRGDSIPSLPYMGKKRRRKELLYKKKHKNIAIMLGMPVHHYIDTFTQMCVDSTMKYLRSKGVAFDRVSTIGVPDVGKARNEIVEIFLKDKNYTHLMWIDSDMAWNPTAVEALINLKTPVASCLVTKKAPPFDVTMFALMRPEEDSKSLDTYIIPLGHFPLDKPFTYPHSGIGTAFMLLEREVIEKMEPPYFGGIADPIKKELKGTDFYFGVQILRNGYQIIYDPRPNIYHVGKCLFGLEDHIAFLDQREEKGIKECQFMSIGAESVEEWKRSFAGPQLSLKAKVAVIVEEQLKENSPSPTSDPASLSEKLPRKDDQTKTGIKTGIEAARLPSESELIKNPTPQQKLPTKIVFANEQEARIGK